MDWGRKWFLDFNAEKTEQVLFDQSNNTDAIDVKMDGSVLEKKKSSFKILGLGLDLCSHDVVIRQVSSKSFKISIRCKKYNLF